MILFAGLSISTMVQEAISKEYFLYSGWLYERPIALMKKRDSPELQLAIPQEYKRTPNSGASYSYIFYYDDSDNGNGPKEKILLACPANTKGEEAETENKWKQTGVMSPEGKLHILWEDPVGGHSICTNEPKPSIRKIEKKNEGEVNYCRKLDQELYEVGYPISDIKGTFYQFVPIYEICYSKAGGKGATQYSIHRIRSPNILAVGEFDKLPKFEVSKYYNFPSPLDSTLSTRKSLKSKNYYPYRFVVPEDMPVKAWKLSVKFLFNYVLITKNEDLCKGMIKADYYIRLYSKKNLKPLTLYSGTHIKETMGNLRGFPLCSRSTKVIKYFWRIIIDDEGYAILLVTQHSPKKCDSTFLCSNNLTIKTYKKGGCIYTCSLNTNDDLFELLDLPPLRIRGDLNFTFPLLETEGTPKGTQASSDVKSSKRTDIINFLNNANFISAVQKIDMDIAQIFINERDRQSGSSGSCSCGPLSCAFGGCFTLGCLIGGTT